MQNPHKSLVFCCLLWKTKTIKSFLSTSPVHNMVVVFISKTILIIVIIILKRKFAIRWISSCCTRSIDYELCYIFFFSIYAWIYILSKSINIIIISCLFIFHSIFVGIHPCRVQTWLFIRKWWKRVFRQERKSIYFYENTIRSRTIYVLWLLSGVYALICAF